MSKENQVNTRFSLGKTVYVIAEHSQTGKPFIKDFEIRTVLISLKKDGNIQVSYASDEYGYDDYPEEACFSSKEELIAGINS